ncbi:MAG: hypothetical protein ACKO04_15935 [Actinomycetes bacterium]
MNESPADLRAVGDADPVTRQEVRRLAGWDRGPCVSIVMPTHRFRPDIGEDPLRLRGLLDEAHARLCALGLRSSAAWQVLAPHRELLGRLDFWLHQSFGLALFAAPGFHRRFRVPVPLEQEVTVGSRFRVRQLLSLPAGDEQFSVLALSPRRVRLFAATPTTFAELPLAEVPEDEASAVVYDDPERQSHTRSPLGRSRRLHGHGAADPPQDEELVRFLAAVDRGLRTALRPERGPLVVAGTGPDLDAFSRVTRQPESVVGRVEGDPGRWGLRELHARAYQAARPALEAERAAALRRVQEASDERVLVDLAEIARAAEQGRVASLLVASGSPTGTWAGDTLDQAIAATLGHGGAALSVEGADLRRGHYGPPGAPFDAPCAAAVLWG